MGFALLLNRPNAASCFLHFGDHAFTFRNAERRGFVGDRLQNARLLLQLLDLLVTEFLFLEVRNVDSLVRLTHPVRVLRMDCVNRESTILQPSWLVVCR